MSAPPQAPTTVDLLVVLTRVETKLDAQATGLADHETRIRALERSRWPLPAIGALTGIAALIAAVWPVLGH